MITSINHPTTAELEACLDHVRDSPKNDGVLEMIVRRPRVNEREVIEVCHLDVKDGLVGDSWIHRGSSKTSDGGPHPEMQITLMNSRVVALVAQERERWPLAGDQFYIDMDLSKANLPAGSQLSIGSAIIEVTAPPHTGCNKFVSRFGIDAMKFVNSPLGKELCLRGVHARVIQNGDVRIDDVAHKI